ncbi:MAG: nicotinate-nucleotide diphosphorylase, partial [Candidatus Krumholzibacteriia bacterium]
MPQTFPDEKRVRALIAAALEEDTAAGDVTVAYLGVGSRRVHAHLLAGESGVLAGIEVVRMTFDERDASVRFDRRAQDGKRVRPGDLVAVVTGPAAAVLSAERVALNFLQHLSGVATITARFVASVQGKATSILDTRKTVPLMRELERYAVRVGGGRNHRFNLGDMILIKENHIASAGGVAAA